MSLGPAPVLALLLGILHVSIYVLIRGSAGRRLPWLVLAAFLGAWAGDALAARLDIALIMVGDFHVIVASMLAWVGIAGVAIVAILGSRPKRDPLPGPRATSSMPLSRSRAARALVDPDPMEPDTTTIDRSAVTNVKPRDSA